MKKKVAIIGYGVIGKRVADAVAKQDDMELTGVCDVISDWRIHSAIKKGYAVYAATSESKNTMQKAGIPLAGDMHDLLEIVDLVVDCTPKKIAEQNLEVYKTSVLLP